MKLLGSNVPETAEKLYEKADTYRRQVVSLELIVQNYNKIVTCLNDVEEPLVKKRIIAMDKEDAKEYVKRVEEVTYGYAKIIGEVIPRGMSPLIVY